jgi:hypothetical protein
MCRLLSCQSIVRLVAVTGSSAFSLMFGRSLNEMKDYTVGNQEGSEFEINIDDVNVWKRHIEKVQSLIYPAILDRTMNKKSSMMKSLDKQRKLLTANAFPVGAVVMLNDPHRQNKFEPKYIGPYSIVRRTRNGNYQLTDGTGEFLERHITPDQLKLVSKTPREADVADDVYVVDHRGAGDTLEYLTKFKNYPTPSWIAHTNFVDTACIQKYWKNLKRDQSS